MNQKSLIERTTNDILIEVSYVEENCEAMRQDILRHAKCLDEPMDKLYLNEKIARIQSRIPELTNLVGMLD